MIFQYFSRQILFSRTFQESPLNSSTFQACVNPVITVDETWAHYLDVSYKTIIKAEWKKIHLVFASW